MPIYEFKRNERFEVVQPTTMVKERIEERYDLQALLIKQIDIIEGDCLVIAEEYSNFSDSGRRIDILAVDQNANLVVIELKRNTGEHMELQAIRYAAMVSTMTLEDAVEAHKEFLQVQGIEENAEERIKTHVGEDKFTDDSFNADVRIILVSEEFNKEITSSVLWLNERDLDIKCVRLKAYNFEDRILFDVQQLIPLPETSDFQMQVQKKEQRQRSSRKKAKISLEFKAVLEAYEEIRSPEFPIVSPKKPVHYAQMRRPEWSEYLHYEFEDDKNSFWVEIHLERVSLSPIGVTIKNLGEKLSNEFPSSKSFTCDPSSKREDGRFDLYIEYARETSPHIIAGDMAKLIEMTHQEIHAALEKHELLECSDG